MCLVGSTSATDCLEVLFFKMTCCLSGKEGKMQRFSMHWKAHEVTHTRELIFLGSNVGPNSVGLVHTWDPIELC